MNTTTTLLTKARLKSIVLNHMYPNGNINYLLSHTEFVNCDSAFVKFSTSLPDDHWAFTQEHKPSRFYANKNSVCDRVRETMVASFVHNNDAEDYAVMLNNRFSITGKVPQ